MSFKRHGKYTKMSKTNPQAIGQCDYSGLVVRHADLKKQMQYSGTGLYWTGLWVYTKFIDKPNPQNLAPRVKADPVPVDHARPSNMVTQNPDYSLVIDVSGLSSYQMTLEQGSSTPLILTGTPTPIAMPFQFPMVIGQWTLINSTPKTVAVRQIGPISPSNPAYLVLSNATQVFYGNGQTLSLTPPIP